MKHILFFAAAALALSGCSKDDGGTPAPEYLRQVEVQEYLWSYGQPGTTGQTCETRTYDPSGNLTRLATNYYSWAGFRNPESDDYKYDSRNRVIERTHDGILDSRSVYTYNEFDSVLREEIYGASGLTEVCTYTYGTDRRPTRKDRSFPGSPGRGQYTRYTYGSNTVTEALYNEQDNALTVTVVRQYDSRKRLIREEQSTPTSAAKVYYRAQVSYNADGNVSSMTEYNLYDQAKTSTYSYNAEKQVVNVHVLDGQLNRESDFKYTYTYASR